jgi:hypothetical protein
MHVLAARAAHVGFDRTGRDVQGVRDATLRVVAHVLGGRPHARWRERRRVPPGPTAGTGGSASPRHHLAIAHAVHAQLDEGRPLETLRPRLVSATQRLEHAASGRWLTARARPTLVPERRRYGCVPCRQNRQLAIRIELRVVLMAVEGRDDDARAWGRPHDYTDDFQRDERASLPPSCLAGPLTNAVLLRRTRRNDSSV